MNPRSCDGVWGIVPRGGEAGGKGVAEVVWKKMEYLFQSYEKQVLQLPA